MHEFIECEAIACRGNSALLLFELDFELLCLHKDLLVGEVIRQTIVISFLAC